MFQRETIESRLSKALKCLEFREKLLRPPFLRHFLGKKTHGETFGDTQKRPLNTDKLSFELGCTHWRPQDKVLHVNTADPMHFGASPSILAESPIRDPTPPKRPRQQPHG